MNLHVTHVPTVTSVENSFVKSSKEALPIYQLLRNNWNLFISQLHVSIFWLLYQAMSFGQALYFPCHLESQFQGICDESRVRFKSCFFPAKHKEFSDQ